MAHLISMIRLAVRPQPNAPIPSRTLIWHRMHAHIATIAEVLGQDDENHVRLNVLMSLDSAIVQWAKIIVPGCVNFIPWTGVISLNQGQTFRGLYVLLSRNQSGPGRAVQQEQEDNSRNHVQVF